ncbi:hypothetical protein, partial [Moorena sp. SIO4G3]|uniref:hypothetical protein n=1 Tax=Moorena sp. SIO4G3 TaxID=2607821 RepID=UPI0025E55AB3
MKLFRLCQPYYTQAIKTLCVFLLMAFCLLCQGEIALAQTDDVLCTLYEENFCEVTIPANSTCVVSDWDEGGNPTVKMEIRLKRKVQQYPTIIRVWQEEVSQSDWTRPALDDLSLYKGEFFGGYITYTNQL